MPSHRLFRRLLGFIVFVSGLLIMFYLSMPTVVSWDDTNSSPFWSSLDNLSSSVFVPQPGNDVDDTQPRVRGPPGAAVEVQPRCPGRLHNNDDADWDICQPMLTKTISSTVRPAWNEISATRYAQRTNNCDCFRSDFGYFVSLEDITDDERLFPIAFSLLTYENMEQTERLLRLIYRPHNVYCIHVDSKAPIELHDGLEAIANCFDNVFLAKPPISVDWGQISVVQAEILCMRQLLDVQKRWKYFINLVGRDLPLRTNYELVKILQAYDGANDVDGSRNEEQ